MFYFCQYKNGCLYVWLGVVQNRSQNTRIPDTNNVVLSVLSSGRLRDLGRGSLPAAPFDGMNREAGQWRRLGGFKDWYQGNYGMFFRTAHGRHSCILRHRLQLQPIHWEW